MEKNHSKYAARFFILVLLPFILGFFVLPHTQVMDGQMLNTPDLNKSPLQPVSYNFSPPDNMSLPQSINSIFPLSNYLDFSPFVVHRDPSICFEDRGSGLVLADGSKITPDFEWIVTLNKDQNIFVGPNSTGCLALKNNRKNSYEWYLAIKSLPNNMDAKGNVVFDPETATYPREVMDYGFLQGLVMIPVFYLFIFYPAAGIWKKIHKGLLEQ